MPSTPAYEFDVFLSYRRWREWPRWVKTVFIGVFEHWLGEELDWEPRVFLDEHDIEQGSWWDQNLGISLSKSKVLVPLFSRKYFQSEWCLTELRLMREREDSCGIRTPHDQRVLIKPAIIHDGEKFPTEARRLQGRDLKQAAFVRTAPQSPTHELLEKIIRDWVPSVATAIETAPPFDPTWQDLSIKKFQNVYRGQYGSQENPRLA